MPNKTGLELIAEQMEKLPKLDGNKIIYEAVLLIRQNSNGDFKQNLAVSGAQIAAELDRLNKLEATDGPSIHL